MHAVARVDPFDQVNLAVVIRCADQVRAGPVERHGIERRQDADVAHLRIGGRRIAVAVDREVVGHADIEDTIPAMIRHGLRCLGHRLEEIVLLGQRTPDLARIGRLAGRMDPGLATRRGDTDRHVLDGTAETAHGVPLEVREDDREVVVEEAASHDVAVEMFAARDRQLRLALGIHDDHRSDGRESVVGSRLEVALRIGTAAAVGRVALHDRTVHLPHQVADEGGLQEVVTAGFAGREFDGHIARGRAAERLVDLHEIFGRDPLEEIDLRKRCFGRGGRGGRGIRSGGRRLLPALSVRTAGCCKQRSQEHGHDLFFHGLLSVKEFQKWTSKPAMTVARGMG